MFTAETQSSQRSEYFVIKSSLLRVLSASAVKSPALFHHIDVDFAENYRSPLFSWIWTAETTGTTETT